MTQYSVLTIKQQIGPTDIKTAVLTATDQKLQKNNLKGDITQHHVDIQAM